MARVKWKEGLRMPLPLWQRLQAVAKESQGRYANPSEALRQAVDDFCTRHGR